MALTYNEISATTERYFVPKLIDNIFGSNALLQRIRNKKAYKPQDGGTMIVQPLLYAVTSAAGTYSGTDTLATTANDQITAGAWTRAHYYSSITITHTDELQNSGDAAVVDFVRSKVQAAEMTLSHNLGTGIYNVGTDDKAIIGLRLAVDSTGTYGGIDRSSYTWWSAQEDSTSTTLTLSLLQGLIGDCTVGNSKPTVIMTTQDIYDILMNLIEPQQRFADEDTANAGFTNLRYAGIPVIVDSHCPASHMFLINENFLTLYYHPRDNFRFEPFVRPIDQAVATARVYWAGQMVINNCRMMGKFGAITA